jgi:8-oxo-dGTP pyrophosphatase MutT (NUDIX family)
VSAFDDLCLGLAWRLAAPAPGHQTSHGGPPALNLETERAAGCREAAALALLIPRGDLTAVVLTVRNPDLRHHAGQVSLPGGALEAGETHEAAALREAAEELGLTVAPRVLGRLTPLYVPPSRFCLTPVVAALPVEPRWAPDAREVQRVLLPTLEVLGADEALRRERRLVGGARRTVVYFQVGEHKVWGATAQVLRELVAVWKQSLAA